MKKVLHVSETVHGGIATYLDELLPYQCAEMGSDNVAVLFPEDQSDCLNVQNEGCYFNFVRQGRTLKSFFNLAKSYLTLYKEFSPDIVHLHSSFAGIIVRLMHSFQAKKNRPVILYCSHGWAFSMGTSALKKKLYIFLEKFFAKTTDKIICISEFEKELAVSVGFDKNQCVVVYNGINETPPKEIIVDTAFDPEKTNVLFVGRFHYAKGFDTLPSLFENLGDNFHLFAAGGARLENEEDISVPSNVTKLGWLSKGQLEYLYKRVDFVIVPSRWEGFGFVPVESMRAKKPVIATRNGALPETVKHEKNGLLYDIKDDNTELVNLIRSVDKEKLEAMGEYGHEFFMKNFTSNITSHKLSELYDECLKIKNN